MIFRIFLDTPTNNPTMYVDVVLMFCLLAKEVMGQNTKEATDSFLQNMDFRVRNIDSRESWLIFLAQGIMVGVVGFWGGVFCMGSVYLLMVLAKRVFHPEEAEKSAAWK